MSFSKGYSLIEVLLAVTLIAVIMIAATQFLFTTLSGTGKATALAVIKQNGDHAVGVIDRRIRDAQSVDCPTADSLLLTYTSATDTTFSITAFRVTLTTVSGDAYLTSSRIVSENFTCLIISGIEGVPDVVQVTFQLRLGNPGSDRPEEVVVEQFETRTSLRTY